MKTIGAVKCGVHQFHLAAEPVELEFVNLEFELAVGLRAHEIFDEFFGVVDEPEVKGKQDHNDAGGDEAEEFSDLSGYAISGQWVGSGLNRNLVKKGGMG